MGLEGGFRKQVERAGRVLALGGALVSLPPDSAFAHELQKNEPARASVSKYLPQISAHIAKDGFSTVLGVLERASSSIDMRHTTDLPEIRSIKDCQGAYVIPEGFTGHGAYFLTANHCLDVPGTSLEPAEFTRHRLSDLAVKWDSSYQGKALVVSKNATTTDFVDMTACVIGAGVKKEQYSMPCGIVAGSGAPLVQQAINEGKLGIDTNAALLSSDVQQTSFAVFPKMYGVLNTTGNAPLNGFSGGITVALTPEGTYALMGTLSSFIPSNNELGTAAFFSGLEPIRKIIASEQAKYPTAASLY